MRIIEEINIPETKKAPRCFLLLSGGLDSLLAGALMKKQGIEVIAISFSSPFFGYRKGKKAAQQLDIPFIAIDISTEQIEIVKNPKYGYGKNLNPCIDCHAQMIKIACSLMDKYKVDFIVTGEVLGERPKSQNKKALRIVAEESGCPDKVLRPLSAKLLDETEPERFGLVNREALLDISGRSRRRQLELARELGIEEFETPGGGCLLTEPVFSGKLRKLLKIKERILPEDVELIKYGRNFFYGDFWIVVARNESESRKLAEIRAEDDIQITTADAPGPVTIVRKLTGTADKTKVNDAIRKAALYTIRYSRLRESEAARVKVDAGDKETIVEFKKEDWAALIGQSNPPLM